MAQKRPSSVFDISSSGDSETDDADTFFFGPRNVDTYQSDTDKSSQSHENESSDSRELNAALYDQCLKEKLKKKLSHSLNHKAKKTKCETKPKDAFTRFSVTYFSKVIESLSTEHKNVIVRYGFASLLKFEKCFVPNEFAMWVARQVDYKSGDIILSDKIISLTKESVHLVLDLPIGGPPFPVDSSNGNAKLLSRFDKTSVPSVKFFGKRLINKVDMCDEDVVTCFLLVALNCFLCPNSSLVPSSRYLSIFENIDNAHKYDWCEFVLNWLFDGIKSFSKGKDGLGKDPNTLGGCLSYISVFYLDFVDFGHRRLPAAIPRILVWKHNLIKKFAELDKKSIGAYGLRPLMDISRTCYSKQSIFLHKPSPSLYDNSDFMEKLDTNSGCCLPESLKYSICKLLEDYSFKCSLCINMDITSIATLPPEMKKTFSSLLEHVYSVDARTQDLVLNLLKVISDACPNDVHENDLHYKDSSQAVSSMNNAAQEELQRPNLPVHQEQNNEHLHSISPSVDKGNGYTDPSFDNQSSIKVPCANTNVDPSLHALSVSSEKFSPFCSVCKWASAQCKAQIFLMLS